MSVLVVRVIGCVGMFGVTSVLQCGSIEGMRRSVLRSPRQHA